MDILVQPLNRVIRAEPGVNLLDALRAYLEDSSAPAQILPPLTRSRTALRPGVDLDDMSAVWEMVDEGASFRDGADARR